MWRRRGRSERRVSASPASHGSSRRSSRTSRTCRPDGVSPTGAASRSGRSSSSSPDLGGIERPKPSLSGTRRRPRLCSSGSRRRPVRRSGAAPSTEVFWAVRRMLEEISARRPLLVALEDPHWAEPTMLDLVEYLAAFASGPLVLLCIARPELLDARPTLSVPRRSSSVNSRRRTEELVRLARHR